MAPSRKSSKKSAAGTPRKTDKPPARAKAPEPAHDPDFVRSVSPADRKAALERVLDEVGVKETIQQTRAPTPAPAPPAPPAFVRERSPADRKAVVERLVEASGVGGALQTAPWKRPTPPPAPTPAPAAPAGAPERARVAMTKAPLEQTTGKSAPAVVILDSNALMMQFQFHVDIEREVRRILNFSYNVIVPSIVVDELQRIAKEGAAKEATEARLAIELAKTFRIVDSPGDGDTGILRLAEQLNAVVVTNDKVLRARLRAKDIPNIYMRSRAFLTIEGHIPGM